MGCGSSSAAVSPQPERPNSVKKNQQTLPKEELVVTTDDVTPRRKKKSVLKEKAKAHQSPLDENFNKPPLPATVPKPVAFDVNFGDQGSASRRPSLPRRLSSRLSLAPLESAPKLSYEMLLEKQRLAEDKREKALEKNKKLSRRSSKRRLEIMQAKEFEKEQQDSEVKDKVKTAEEKRQAKLDEVREKQKKREERARRAREKVRRMSEQPAEEALTVDVEKDDNFNKDDDVDSWLNDDGDAFCEDPEERLRKKNTAARDDSGNYSTRAVSASTTDSFDYAFQRQNVKPPLQNGIIRVQGVANGAADDFFDS
ncbi:uncharacterized protein LOC135485369 isoform X2 [Lineus longissimus]|uniref:uncharacterized protein LOC135485369 isoform X2 n=1 Tax=Lineus longissimus TaxID=88925 RepID=UPI002B4C9B26